MLTRHYNKKKREGEEKNTPWFILFLISRKASQVNQHTLTCKSPIGPCINQVFLSHTLINKRWQVSTLSLLPSNLSTHTTQIPLFLSLLRILRTYKNSHSLSLFKSKPLTKFTPTRNKPFHSCLRDTWGPDHTSPGPGHFSSSYSSIASDR